jgi:CheY-like chemotaxis protein
MSFATHVLLVEDDPLTAFTTARSLRRSGYVDAVTVATDGREAFELLQSGTLALDHLLVLTDLSMPRMSGLELAKAMRADPRLREQPIVVLTTSINGDDRAAATELGVVGFFVKSHSIPHLHELLEWIRTFRPGMQVQEEDPDQLGVR